MPILLKLLLGRQTRRLALKALRSKAFRDLLKSKRVRKALMNRRTRRLVFRQLGRVMSRGR